MKRSVRILLMIVPLALLAAACMPEPSLVSDLFLDDNSLITGEPCGAPCWDGITPGETTWVDATNMVQADPNFEGFETNAEGGLQQAVWQKAGSGQYCCRLIADDTEGALISYIFLALSSPNIIVDNVLEVHGDPTYVTTFPFTSTESVVQLIYPDVPMVVSALVGDSNSSLLANSDIVAVLYMDQTQMDLILQTTELKAWAGYQSYGAYDQGTPVITPAMTLTPPPEQ